MAPSSDTAATSRIFRRRHHCLFRLAAGPDEDDAAQAVRAGLDAVIAVREMSLRAPARIAFGPVVVGDLDAAGRRQTGAVAGETPNLAVTSVGHSRVRKSARATHGRWANEAE